MNSFGGEQILDAQRNAFKCSCLARRNALVAGLRHLARLLRRFDDVGVEVAMNFHGREIGVREIDG